VVLSLLRKVKVVAVILNLLAANTLTIDFSNFSNRVLAMTENATPVSEMPLKDN